MKSSSDGCLSIWRKRGDKKNWDKEEGSRV